MTHATDTVPDRPALAELIADGVEAPISLNEAARLPELCRDGKPMNVAKLYRHARRACRGVLFPTALQAGRLVTTRPAVRWWILAMNERRECGGSSAGPTPRQQQAAAKRAHASAMAELERAGLTRRRNRK